jgi:hypothetical protein
LPAILFFPANDKLPPFREFSGVGKVGPMMNWAHSQCSIKFDMGQLPQFNDEDTALYKEQINERAEYYRQHPEVEFYLDSSAIFDAPLQANPRRLWDENPQQTTEKKSTNKKTKKKKQKKKRKKKKVSD